MNQTNETSYSYSDGLAMEVSTDSEATWLDAGVLEDGVSWTFNFALGEVEWGNAENPDSQAKNLQVAIAPSNLASWNSEVLEAISGGLMTRTAVAGTLVSGATDLFSSGEFALNTAYLLDGQNASGLVQTINSVTGTVDGGLVLGTHYEIVKVFGGWAIIFLTGVTLAQYITVDYDYTPASGYTITAGTTSKVLVPYVVRLRHYTDADFITYDFELKVFRVTPDAGGITLNKLGAKSDNSGYDLWSLAMTGNVDTSRTDGAQLFSQFQTT